MAAMRMSRQRGTGSGVHATCSPDALGARHHTQRTKPDALSSTQGARLGSDDPSAGAWF